MDAVNDRPLLDEFVALCGAAQWRERLASLRRDTAGSPRAGRHVRQRHGIELVIERFRGAGEASRAPAERRILALVADAVALWQGLNDAGKKRFEAGLARCLAADACLVPVFHLLRTAALQRARGFEIDYAGLDDGASFDLLIRRGGVEAEVACEVVSAEEGRALHRGAWFRLVDRVDPELQTWLRAHPGRYLLKLNLPAGLRDVGDPDGGPLPALHARITDLLRSQKRADADEAAVLRLDPLLLAAAQADELGLMPRLRREFGPEAHLAVTTAGGGIFVLAARAGQQNEVAAAVHRHMAAAAPRRLTGQRPGILAMFIEDTDRLEWRELRDQLELEGEARKFLTLPVARPVVAVTCTSRLELFDVPEPDAAPDGELRFRNAAHPAAKRPELAPAIQSSV